MSPLSSRKHQSKAHEFVLLMLEIPRTNDKKELAAEQMLAALHGMLKPKRELRMEGHLQEHISLEITSIGQRIRFYIWTPKHLQAFVEGQIYAQYPTVQIYDQQTDYAERRLEQPVIHSTELVLTDHETIPIKTFPSFEVDPLAAITATLAKLDNKDEEVWIQIMARPVSDNWHKKGAKMVSRIKGGGLFGGSGFAFVGQAVAALVRPPDTSGKSGEAELSERDKTRIKAIEEKSTKLGYQVKVRIVYAGHDQHTAKLRMQAIVGAFKQFNTTNLNGFQGRKASFDSEKQIEYQTRFFIDNGYILNIEELASLFHLPHTTVETPNIVWATTKTAEPPANIPVMQGGNDAQLSLFGVTNFRGTNTVFGINRADRGRHMYIIGQTGTGKSGLLELLTLSDIYYDQGFAVIDPHGDYAQNIMRFIPHRRLNDVIYFNPADTEYPIGFNPLEVTDPSLKNHISSELVGVLKRMFESWGPRLEYILRYTILALLDYPNSTMLDITRMLVEKKFRDDVIKHISDPVVKNFWTIEFASWNDKFAAEAVAPVLNKVGAFVANPMIRNIIGQTKSTFNIRKHMDEGKILVVNLSRGLVGEDNAAILGALMVTKIQLSAMSRANIELHERRPFYLYVDEFQNFATDSFAVILSEARKYGLNLTVANQYVAQMNPVVKDAIFGNVGSMVSFRVGADDAAFMSKYFAPQFEPGDLMQLHNRYFVSTMTINGEKTPAFSGSTLNQPPAQSDFTQLIIENSRMKYAVPRAHIEGIILANNDQLYDSKPVQRDQPRPQNAAQPVPPNQGHPTPPRQAQTFSPKSGQSAPSVVQPAVSSSAGQRAGEPDNRKLPRLARKLVEQVAPLGHKPPETPVPTSGHAQPTGNEAKHPAEDASYFATLPNDNETIRAHDRDNQTTSGTTPAPKRKRTRTRRKKKNTEDSAAMQMPRQVTPALAPAESQHVTDHRPKQASVPHTQSGHHAQHTTQAPRTPNAPQVAQIPPVQQVPHAQQASVHISHTNYERLHNAGTEAYKAGNPSADTIQEDEVIRLR